MLLSHGIGNEQMHRSQTRTCEIKAALERLSARTVHMLRRPDHYTAEQRESVALDLYLLSGAWLQEAS